MSYCSRCSYPFQNYQDTECPFCINEREEQVQITSNRCCDSPDLRLNPEHFHVCMSCGVIQDTPNLIAGYSDYQRSHKYYVYPGYVREYHIEEVLKRLESIEANKPSQQSINDLKSKLSNNFSIENIRKHSKYKKHIVYMYCCLNDKPYLRIAYGHRIRIKRSIMNLYRHSTTRNLPRYHTIMYYICNKYGYDYIIPFLSYRELPKDKKDLIYKHI